MVHAKTHAKTQAPLERATQDTLEVETEMGDTYKISASAAPFLTCFVFMRILSRIFGFFEAEKQQAGVWRCAREARRLLFFSERFSCSTSCIYVCMIGMLTSCLCLTQTLVSPSLTYLHRTFETMVAMLRDCGTFSACKASTTQTRARGR